MTYESTVKSGQHESPEHATIADAAKMLALATEGGEMSHDAWLTQVRLGLAEVMRSLEAHGAAAEAPAGILSEMDVSMGRCEHITAARRDHAELLAETACLIADIDGCDSPEGTGALLQRAGWLADAFTRHADDLAELRMASFNLDIGVGD
jgi:tellurite resistance protein